MLAVAIRTSEEGILAIEGDRADARDHIGINLDAAVIQEARQSFPAGERIANSIGQLGFLADQTELGSK